MISGNFLKNKKVGKRLSRFIKFFYIKTRHFCLLLLLSGPFLFILCTNNARNPFFDSMTHPITCRSPHNLPFFPDPKKQVMGGCTVNYRYYTFERKETSVPKISTHRPRPSSTLVGLLRRITEEDLPQISSNRTRWLAQNNLHGQWHKRSISWYPTNGIRIEEAENNNTVVN